MTNRDKFNSMNNAELADILSQTLGADTCKFCCYAKEKCLGKSCTEGIEAWLNASCEPENPPADKKVVDEVTHDNVNHPDHGKIEFIEFTEDKELGFCLDDAIKYISRLGRNNSDKMAEDLQKVTWYIKRRIGRLERTENDRL